MLNDTKVPLTSAEIANLWDFYMADTLIACVKKHMLARVQDDQIRPVLEQALTISEQRARDVAAVFESSGIPVPYGFSDKDVDPKAPRLFSDTFALYHALYRSRWALLMGSTALFMAARPDVRKIFQNVISGSTKLNEQAIRVALEKGLFIRSPIVSVPPQPHIVEEPGYIGSIIGEHRPFHVSSVMFISLSIQENILGQALITGFAQVARDPEVRRLFMRGADIGSKHIKVLGSLLSNEKVPMPATPDSMVTVSTVPPFSDKLMLNHITLINAINVADIGLAIAKSNRADIAATFMRLAAEVTQYGEDAVNISIKKGWMEAPPQVVSHRELALRGGK